MKKAAKILGFTLLGLCGLVVLLYLAALAVNWKDEDPSAQALAFQQLIDARPQVPDAENAYVYMLGFAAPRGQDPREVGARRRAWLADHTWRNRDVPDPIGQPQELRNHASPGVAELQRQCAGVDDRRPCAEAFRRLAGQWQPDADETLLLERYRALLAHRAWREVVPADSTAPIPPYSEITHAQRLYLVALLQRAHQGDAQAVREGLQADSLYWRNAMDQAQSLISLLMASVGLRNHYLFGSEVLAAFPAGQVAAARPPDWEREFTAQERSLRLALASELAFNRNVLEESTDEAAWRQYEHGWFDLLLFKLSAPFLQLQATLNGAAEDYARLCDEFAVPLHQYAEAEQKVLAARRELPLLAVYNPTGTMLRQVAHPNTFIVYVYRVASSEGLRRAAMLMTQLKARGVPVTDAAAEVASSALRDPYTQAPFEWDATRQALVFMGPEQIGTRRHEFFY